MTIVIYELTGLQKSWSVLDTDSFCYFFFSSILSNFSSFLYLIYLTVKTHLEEDGLRAPLVFCCFLTCLNKMSGLFPLQGHWLNKLQVWRYFNQRKEGLRHIPHTRGPTPCLTYMTGGGGSVQTPKPQKEVEGKKIWWWFQTHRGHIRG